MVGCSPAWPNPGGAQSGYLVEGEGRLLLDCGPGVLSRLREADEGWPRVDAIAITHFHLDHWGDIVPWVWGRMYGLGRDLAEVVAAVQPPALLAADRDERLAVLDHEEGAERGPAALLGDRVAGLKSPLLHRSGDRLQLLRIEIGEERNARECLDWCACHAHEYDRFRP